MLLSKLYAYLAGFGAIFIAILGAWGIAKRSGKKEEQAAETKRALEQSKGANEIDTRVRNMSAAELDERLRASRPAKKQ